MKKVNFPINETETGVSWLIPGALTLVSTYNSEKEPNIAPKNWIHPASFSPPLIVYSGPLFATTEKNIIETNCFAINFVDSSLAEIACNCIRWFGNERIAKSDLNLVEASKINAPLIFECKVHLECTLHNMYIHEHGFVVLGEVVAVSMWDKILRSGPEKRYALLDLTIPRQNGFSTLTNKIKPIPGFSETIQIHKEKVEQYLKEKS